MAAKIVNLTVENLPAIRLIGRRYTEAEALGGSFGAKWAEWFAEGLFAPLEALPKLAENGDSYVGAMREGADGAEYWIGMFLPAGTPVPDGYESADLAPRAYAVSWLYGDESSGELYGASCHAMCLSAIRERGLTPDARAWCFERYVCPRFTTPDAAGRVILDYGIAIA